MSIKLFLLGRPGCGKSSAAKHIEKRAKDKGWFVHRFKDFDILQEMFVKDTRGRFKPTVYQGFDVIDPIVLDEALDTLNNILKPHIPKTDANTNKILLIEFARDNYLEALKHFSKDILQDAYFLSIDAKLDTCMQRIQKRMINPIPPDDHYISEETLQRFYSTQIYPTDNTVVNNVVIKNSNFLDNNRNSLPEFMTNVNNFVSVILK